MAGFDKSTLVYVIMAGSLAYLWALVSIMKTHGLNRKLAIVASVWLALISAARFQFGGDYASNRRAFQSMNGLSLREAIQSGDEVGASALRWVLFAVNDDPQFFFFATAALTIGSFLVFFLRYSPDPLLSLFLFVSLGPYFTAHNITMQYLAIALLLWSLPFVIEGRSLSFVLVVLLAVSLHTSALVFILLLPLSRMKTTRRAVVVYVIAGVLVSLFFSSIINSLFRFVYSDYSDGQYGFIGASLWNLVLPTLLGVLLIIVNKASSRDGSARPSCTESVQSSRLNMILSHAALITILLQVIGVSEALIASRVAEYFFALSTVTIPMAIAKFSPGSRVIARLVVLSVALTYLLVRNQIGALTPTPYLAFWNA